jgi:hypothetical protein
MSISLCCFSASIAESARFPFARLLPTTLGAILILLACQLASGSHEPGVASPAGVPRAVVTLTALPPGTILPLRLDKSMAAKDAQKGQPIEAKIAQEVPLSTGFKIPVRSTVNGSIVSVERDSDGTGLSVTLKFNQLDDRKETVSISTYLRAIASSRAVRDAQSPLTGADTGSPMGWSTTVQIGGDIRYGDGGAVRNQAKQKVGKGVSGGVLVHVHENGALGCEGPVNMDDHLQALWLFSSNACGTYDLKGVKITHTGKNAPVGEFTLHFEKEDMRLESGTGILLRIASPQP